ncbi:NOP protein chaperone 1 [Hyperolius riggenbachi]|uniref:NOP protein chaperone 1 n=1 Tax=Hyperolius riggenbachi TaxID=752182 RepID=UPI0035A2A032
MEAAGGPREKLGYSAELLEVGSSGGLYNKLLVNPKQNKSAPSPTVRMPRSSILDRVQSFLPQMAQANEKLSKEIETSPSGTFDIENVEDEEKVIEMNVSVVELSSSDSSEEEEENSSDESSDAEGEVTEHNIRLALKGKKGKIEDLTPNS